MSPRYLIVDSENNCAYIYYVSRKMIRDDGQWVKVENDPKKLKRIGLHQRPFAPLFKEYFATGKNDTQISSSKLEMLRPIL